MTRLNVWFWQRMVSPHMAYLAAALARRGHAVTYVAEEQLAPERAAMGWQRVDLEEVALRFIRRAEDATALARRSTPETVHLTQGFRSNGLVSAAQSVIRTRAQRHYVIMETVDQRGLMGLVKPALYAFHLQCWRRGLDGILAIGADTPAWVAGLAPAKTRIFPFAYFLHEQPPVPQREASEPFRFLFVGSLIPRKRPGLLLKALSSLSQQSFEVEIIGEGPMRADLETIAESVLPGRVSFRGTLPIAAIPGRMAQSDCLVLPSTHDGWGAVISETLMAGTPVICSSACGARGVVQASGRGGVFGTSDVTALRALLEAALAQGKVGAIERQALRSWAACLSANAGAAYLEALINSGPRGSTVPAPPWEHQSSRTAERTADCSSVERGECQ